MGQKKHNGRVVLNLSADQMRDRFACSNETRTEIELEAFEGFNPNKYRIHAHNPKEAAAHAIEFYKRSASDPETSPEMKRTYESLVRLLERFYKEKPAMASPKDFSYF